MKQTSVGPFFKSTLEEIDFIIYTRSKSDTYSCGTRVFEVIYYTPCIHLGQTGERFLAKWGNYMIRCPSMGILDSSLIHYLQKTPVIILIFVRNVIEK